VNIKLTLIDILPIIPIIIVITEHLMNFSHDFHFKKC